jgi:hypothetical protein
VRGESMADPKLSRYIAEARSMRSGTPGRVHPGGVPLPLEFLSATALHEKLDAVRGEPAQGLKRPLAPSLAPANAAEPLLPCTRIPVEFMAFLRASQGDVLSRGALEPLATCQLRLEEGLHAGRDAAWAETRSTLEKFLHLGLPLLQDGAARGLASGAFAMPAPSPLVGAVTGAPTAGLPLAEAVGLVARCDRDALVAQRLGGGVCRLLGQALGGAHEEEERRRRGAPSAASAAALRFARFWKIAGAACGEGRFRGQPPTFGHGAEDWGAPPQGSRATALSSSLGEFKKPSRRAQRSWATASLNLLAGRFSVEMELGLQQQFAVAPLPGVLSRMQAFLKHIARVGGQDAVHSLGGGGGSGAVVGGGESYGMGGGWGGMGGIFAGGTAASAGASRALWGAGSGVRGGGGLGGGGGSLGSVITQGRGLAAGYPFFHQLYLLLRMGAWAEAYELAYDHFESGGGWVLPLQDAASPDLFNPASPTDDSNLLLLVLRHFTLYLHMAMDGDGSREASVVGEAPIGALGGSRVDGGGGRAGLGGLASGGRGIGVSFNGMGGGGAGIGVSFNGMGGGGAGNTPAFSLGKSSSASLVELVEAATQQGGMQVAVAALRRRWEDLSSGAAGAAGQARSDARWGGGASTSQGAVNPAASTSMFTATARGGGAYLGDAYEGEVLCLLAGPGGTPRVALPGTPGENRLLAPVLTSAEDWAFHRLWFAALAEFNEALASAPGALGAGTPAHSFMGAPPSLGSWLGASALRLTGVGTVQGGRAAADSPGCYTLWDFGGDVLAQKSGGGEWGAPGRAYRYVEMLLLAGQCEAAVAHLATCGMSECPSLHLADATHLALALGWHGLLRTFPVNWAKVLASVAQQQQQQLLPQGGSDGLGRLQEDPTSGKLLYLVPSAAPQLHVLDLQLLLEAFLSRTWPMSQDSATDAALQPPTRSSEAAMRWLDYFSLLPNEAARVGLMGAVVAEVACSASSEPEVEALLNHTLFLCSASNSPSGCMFASSVFSAAASDCSTQTGVWVFAPIRLHLAAATAAASAASSAGEAQGAAAGGAALDLASAESCSAEHTSAALTAIAEPLSGLADPAVVAAGSPLASERGRLMNFAREALALHQTLCSRPGGLSRSRFLHDVSARAASVVHAMLCLCTAFDAAGEGNPHSAETWVAVLRRLEDSNLLPPLGTPPGDLGSVWARHVSALPPAQRGVFVPLVRLASSALQRLFLCYRGSAGPPEVIRDLRRRMGILLGAGGSGAGAGAAVDRETFNAVLAAASALGMQ